MTTFLFKGQLETGRAERSFEKEITAESKKHAKEQLLSTLGSEHGITRSKISIESVEQEE